MEVIGIDIGFGFTKVTNGRQSLVLKSILGEATDIQFQEQVLAADVEDDHLQAEIDGKSWFVGELAERQSNVRFFTLDQSQLLAQFAKNLALAATARMAAGFVPISLVTGLPIGYYRQHKEELARILQVNDGHDCAASHADRWLQFGNLTGHRFTGCERAENFYRLSDTYF